MVREITEVTRQDEAESDLTTVLDIPNGVSFIVGSSKNRTATRFIVITKKPNQTHFPGDKDHLWHTTLASCCGEQLPAVKIVGREQFDKPTTYQQAYQRHMQVVEAIKTAYFFNGRLEL